MAVVSGGTTLIDNGALDAGVPTGSLILLSTQTASDNASISFTTGLDSTYDQYQFHFINCHARSSTVIFSFNGSTDNGSNYNVTKTTSVFTAYHGENDVASGLLYLASNDLSQSTAFQGLSRNLQTNSDDNVSGVLQLFNPSSTTFVKHFISRISGSADAGTNMSDEYVAGYFNTTSAVNAIQFKMTSGNFDGIIKMYGVS